MKSLSEYTSDCIELNERLDAKHSTQMLDTIAHGSGRKGQRRAQGVQLAGNGMKLVASIMGAFCPNLRTAAGCIALAGMATHATGRTMEHVDTFKKCADIVKDQKKVVMTEEEAAKNLIDRRIYAAKEQMKNEQDPEKKERLKAAIDSLNAMRYDDDGKELDPEDTVDLLKKELGTKRYNIAIKGPIRDAERQKHEDLQNMFSIDDDKIKSSKEEDKETAKQIRKAAKEDSGEEKDEEGNVVKDEEITDASGKKIKVKTHTGPRGGKFYWPNGSPKDADHKVYIDKSGKVKESLVSMSDYLNEKIN